MFDGSSFTDPGYGSDFVNVETAAPLGAGAYTFKLTYRTDGFWHCSIYDPDGCSWISGTRWFKTYKFRYDGHTRVEQPPYRAPYSAVTRVQATRRHQQLTVTGAVTARLENNTYRLNPASPLRAAIVKLHKNNRVVATTRSTRSGTFRFRRPAKRPGTYFVQVASTSRYAGATSRTVFR